MTRRDNALADVAAIDDDGPQALTARLVRILENDVPAQSDLNARCLIAAAVFYLHRQYGDDVVIDMLLRDAESVSRFAVLSCAERPAGAPLH